MISSKILALFLGLVSTGSGICWLAGPPATPPRKAAGAAGPKALRPAWQASAFIDSSLGSGTLVSSHSYPLVARTRGRVSHVFFQADQRVKKGDVLLEFSTYSYLVAPADGVVTQRLVETGDYLRAGMPVASFTELGALRLRLRRDSAHAVPRRGQFLQVQSRQRPAQGLTGTVVGSTFAGEFVFLDLRLRTSSPEPLVPGAPVQVYSLRL